MPPYLISWRPICWILWLISSCHTSMVTRWQSRWTKRCRLISLRSSLGSIIPSLINLQSFRVATWIVWSGVSNLIRLSRMLISTCCIYMLRWCLIISIRGLLCAWLRLSLGKHHLKMSLLSALGLLKNCQLSIKGINKMFSMRALPSCIRSYWPPRWRIRDWNFLLIICWGVGN